jgi:phosphomannomutase / phosphoglucomutase
MTKPLSTVTPNTWEFLRDAMIAPTGFREYDARWQYPEAINLPGIMALGLGLGTQMHRRGIEPVIAVGNDYRDYSLSIKNALILGLIQAGIHVKDIGPCLSPMAYFAQFHLDAPAVAMVTASHNPNGWTGVKMGFERPLTHGPEEMAELRDIVLNGEGEARPGGAYEFVEGVREAYLDDLVGDFESHNRLDYTFPHYNPNPEAMEMLHDMSASVKASGADFALGFDGDGDRCGVVDDEGEEIFADKMGVIMARDLSALHPNSTFVADVKSTGLFASDPVLQKNGARADYWKTGHSHMSRSWARWRGSRNPVTTSSPSRWAGAMIAACGSRSRSAS